MKKELINLIAQIEILNYNSNASSHQQDVIDEKLMELRILIGKS